MEEGAVLAPESFLMKGEQVPSHEQWGGNPAREMPQWVPAQPLPAPDTDRDLDQGTPTSELPVIDLPEPATSGRHRAERRQPAGTSAMSNAFGAVVNAFGGTR
jgi:hypothetical protein